MTTENIENIGWYLKWYLKRDHDGVLFPVPEYPKELKVGRDKKSDIVTNDPAAIGIHFSVYNRKGRCVLIDYGAGTDVDGKAVKREIIHLYHDARIMFDNGGFVSYKVIQSPAPQKKQNPLEVLAESRVGGT